MTAPMWGQRRNNLPAEVTRFIGRRRELPAIAEAMERHRLVTLRGAGGVGKTRLALRAAAGASGRFADGCWLVQLSPLREPELLARTVAETLGLPGEAAGDTTRVLAENLAERELLLVLDTCEHLAGACADLAGLLLAAAPGLRVLATSRSPLGAPQEHSLLVTPLELPADDASAGYADAVTLFVDRARAAVPGFALTPENTVAVAELCRRLDGIPLALELAAVRLRGMTPGDILARLDDRFRVLGTSRRATDRHRTLRAAVSWSYELCSPAEQRLWAQLSVFPGGFRLAAAEHVCGPGAGETLSRLVAKSVVQLPPGGRPPGAPRGVPGGPDTRPAGSRPVRGVADVHAIVAGLSSVADDRYQMLDTMREFGAERLAAAGALEGARLRARHRDYYLGLAERAAAGFMTGTQPAWLAKLSVEAANLRVALDYSFTAPGEAAAGVRLTRLLLPYWLMTGQFTEGRRWHDHAVTVASGSGDPASGAWAVYGAGALAVQQGDFAAGGPLLARAAALAAETGDEDLAAHAADARGTLAFYSGDMVTARAGYETALAVYEKTGFSDPTALVSYSRLASVHLVAAEPGPAAERCAECLRRCDALGEQWARGTALWVRGAARWLAGDHAAATEDTLACLRIKEGLGDLHTIAMSFDLLSVCLVAAGDLDRAAVLHGAGESLWTLLNAPVLMGPAYAEIRKSSAATARTALGAERFDALRARGFALPLAAALAVAKGEAPAVPPTTGPPTTGPAASGPAVPPGAGAPGGRAGGTGSPAAKPLTRREKEIAALVAGGLGNREIAERLYLSKRTVDSHLEHIFAKLGFSSRTQLADWVLARDRLA